jgi:hypothetical protein
MASKNDTMGLGFYEFSSKEVKREMPCEVSSHCHTPIMDEERNMVLLFPNLIKFGCDLERGLFAP